MKKRRRWSGGEFIQCDEDSDVGGHETNSEKSTFIHSFILQGDVLGLRGQVGGAAGGRVSASLTSASHFHAARSRRDTHVLSLQLDSASFCPVGTAAGSCWVAAGKQLGSSWLLAKTPAHGYRQLNILFPCRMRSRSWAGRSFLL